MGNFSVRKKKTFTKRPSETRGNLDHLFNDEKSLFAVLKFDGPVIVLGGGHFNEKEVAKLLAQGLPLIAADGAADMAAQHGLGPHAIIGDFDSIKDKTRFPSDVHLFEITEQETTDFEKCLYSVEAPLFICFGMLGKRFDHSLAAIHAVTRFAAEKNIILMDEEDLSIGVEGDFELSLPLGTRFSVYPLTRSKFYASVGLAYPLDGLTLDAGQKIGTSNHTTASPVQIYADKTTSARYFVILPKSHLPALMERIEIYRP